ncbi:MAG: arginase family protein [Anaeromyxobacter sp.]|nr:arginase family protein [Anaeromyxobacter sp.]MBL0275300.1 arginase family protein [Anaeromyxobacter sp.]
MTLVDTLARLLRPPGGGIHLVSTGRAEQAALVRRLAGAADDAAVEARWRTELGRAAGARAVLLGIPCDVGAGFRRGANLAPAAIRAHLAAADPGWFDRARAAGLVDLGDVFTVPQLLHDEQVAPAQLEACRRALHPGLDPAARAALPVSPLSVAEHALRLVLSVNPAARVLALGGDHSAAWPVVAALAAARPGLGVVQVDAHTDLLPERLGIRLCFGTWSFHANQLLGRGGRLVQLGIRASRFERAHWEATLDVRQVWAAEARRDPAAAVERVVGLVRAAGVTEVYLSHDVDGLDPAFAAGTGTPEPDGLDLETVLLLTRRLGREIGLAGGDVMEVAPDLAPTPAARATTLDSAVASLRATAEAALGVAI